MSDKPTVLTQEQFDREWRAREALAKAPEVQRISVRLAAAPVSQVPDAVAVVKAFARPLLAAAIEALLDFEQPVPAPRRPRRIQRK